MNTPLTLHVVDWSIVGPALIAGLLVLSTHVPLGLQVLRRGIVFIDLAIAQIAGLGVIAADALGLPEGGLAVQAAAVGAALRMLPVARVIDCRRDALETCWSCYRQLFAPQRVGFTYDYGSLAAYWRACTNLGDFWAGQQPQRYRVQSYEALVQDPEVQIRALLAFCDLPFEAACLAFHATQRAIRTASALQVRQPLSRTSVRAANYGSLLDPLRSALGLPPA